MTDTRIVTDETDFDLKGEVAEEDRGAFTPRKGMGRSKGGKALMLGVMGLGFVAVVASSLSSHGGKSDVEKDKEAAKTAEQAAGAVVTDPLGNRTMADGKSAVPGAPGEGASLVAGDGEQVPSINGQGQSQRQMTPAEQRVAREQELRAQALAKEQAQLEAMRRAPVMAVTGGFDSRSPAQADARGFNGMDAPEPARKPTAIEDRLQTSLVTTVRAGRLGNRNFLVTAGTQIPCVLQTAMDTTQPGFTSCVVPVNVFSDNGRVVLLEKGTRVLGEFHGGFQQGQTRIFIVWNRAVTPKGVSVNLASPAADQLGRAGMGGEISTFFWKRFSGALLMSIVSDAGTAVSNRLAGLDNVTNVPNRAAEIALENDIKIPPRLRANQGTEMTIFVARDFDFSSVYALRLKR